MSANERRKQILDLLCQRRRDTVQNLATEFGVCERTIRRDIEELTLTYPLETVRGRYGGGVKMADWYFQDRPVSLPEGAPTAPRHLEKFIPAVRITTETVKRHAARAMTPTAMPWAERERHLHGALWHALLQ